MRTEAQQVVDACKEFVRAMGRAEKALGTLPALAAEERTQVVRDVLAWLGTEETGPYTREIARELIGQLSAAGAYADYRGSPDPYIR